MKKIAAVVVTYNRRQLLRECVEALLRCSKSVDIFVIDNDDSKKVGILKSSKDRKAQPMYRYMCNGRVRYYALGKNLGGAGGFCYGIKTAYRQGYEYFWLMDDDTIIDLDTLPELLLAGETVGGNWGYLSSLALWEDGTPCLMNHHKPAKDWEQSKEFLKNGIIKIQMATFVSFLVKREVIEKVGLPYKEYFIWGDDTEYSSRIAEFYPCFLAGRSIVTHKMKNNESANLFQMKDIARIERVYYSIRNDMCTYRRKGMRTFTIFVAEQIYHFVHILFCCKKYKRKKLEIILRGLMAGLVFSPKIEWLDTYNRVRKCQ